ncbi:carbon starvation protein A [Bacteroidota bacterium]
MITFILSFIALLLGYLFYSKLVERIFGADPNRETPAYKIKDGVDFVPMKWGKIFLIQFLNITGLGPIFGAILGAVYGPVAFIWIVFGCIFAGAVHDYFSGMLSLKHNGLSIPEVVGKYLGNGVRQFMRGFTVILMILVGAVFILGPADILSGFSIAHMNFLTPTFWAAIIIVYYLIATLLPINKIIGRIYPFFGAVLLFMALGIIISMFASGEISRVPELIPENMVNMKHNASQYPIFPMLFITIACGAISGFHATQSPLMARCLKNEKKGRQVFYGAMITEGMVALIWAAAAMSFFENVDGLNDILVKRTPAAVVNIISNSMLGKVGGVLAILGVVAAPITSGDTAFRSARLIVADFMKINQVKISKRLLISIPLFIAGLILTQIHFNIIWRYFGWANQTLATIVLWAITVYLLQEKKFYWITLIPAAFMTAVITTYIFTVPEGFNLHHPISVMLGIGVTVILTSAFFYYKRKIK